MSANKISFSGYTPVNFSSEIKQRVNDYFTQNNISTKANASMIIKTIVLLSITFGSYALILSGWLTHLEMIPFCILMGVGIAGVGFSVSHDALHGAYSSNKKINTLIGYSFDLLGANGYVWKISHNVIHHTYTNIYGHDEDLEVAGFIRLSPRMPHKPIHRIQHILAFFAYSFSTIFWVFIKDYQYLLRKDVGPYVNKKHPASQIIFLVVTKIFYYTYTIFIPIWVLHLTWWQFLIGFFIVHLIAGLILGVIFQLAHVVEETQHPIGNEEGNIENLWMVHQLQTTSDFARNNKWLSWYIGGLNFQVEHHLFPKICSIHYSKISPIVEEVAHKYGIPFNSHNSLRVAIRSHYRTLKRFGDPSYIYIKSN